MDEVRADLLPPVLPTTQRGVIAPAFKHCSPMCAMCWNMLMHRWRASPGRRRGYKQYLYPFHRDQDDLPVLVIVIADRARRDVVRRGRRGVARSKHRPRGL